jgi:hypothetical protein
VYAEWVLIGENDRGSTYVDPDTIRRQEDLVRIWQMLDEKAPDTIRGSSFLSIMAQIECDCAEERMRGLSISYHSGNMGGGQTVSSDSGMGKWTSVPPGTVTQALWTFACSKQ